MGGACCCTRPGGHEERARSPTTRLPPHAPTRQRSRGHVTHVVEQAAIASPHNRFSETPKLVRTVLPRLLNDCFY